MTVRHRPDTSMSTRIAQRPESRASTTSAASQNDDVTQSLSQSAFIAGNPEAALLNYHAGLDHAPQYDLSQHPHMGHTHSQSASFSMQGGYPAHDTAYMPQDVQYSGHVRVGSVPITEGGDEKRRKGAAVTATNDKELREMLARNEGRPLKEVAQEVIQKERTPMAEKTKQLFAMLWLRAVCKPAKTSVPRNRVYSQYASRCGTERVVPLNPASFGKLVRVIFPGIQTRRLGVRGESKYHYVDLALEEENPNVGLSYSNGFHGMDSRPRSQSASTQQIDFNNIPRLQADTAAFPTEGSFDLPSAQPAAPRGPASKGQAFAYPDTRGMNPGSVESMTYPQTLRFPSSNLTAFAENEMVNLPAIQPYLPPKTDHDTADALAALYRTHCTSLIDSIRFCKEKQFFKLYTSFHGTLTVPVQKLFTHPNLAPWIEQCDLVMYRTMVRFVSRLTLQAAPVVVINILATISANLHAHIAKTFAQQPPHVLDAKLRPATVFAGLLYRLIRVNQSAHAAANLLTIDHNREQMWREWSTMVNPKRVMEAELPDCGYEEVYHVLTSGMRSLLEPLPFSDITPNHNTMNEDLSTFQPYSFDENGSFAAFLQSQSGMSSQQQGTSTSNISTETILDRWSAFINGLPARFPHASARTLLHCISVIGTAALRDITIMNGVSYGHWWVLKIFVDELALWGAEMGGFLEGNTQEMVAGVMGGWGQQSPISASASQSGSGNSSHHSGNGSRAVSMGADAASNSAAFDATFHAPQQQHHLQPAPPNGNGMPFHPPPHRQQTFQYQPQPQQQMMSFPAHHHHHHRHGKQQEKHDFTAGDIDDSGIGMSLMDDDATFANAGRMSVDAV